MSWNPEIVAVINGTIEVSNPLIKLMSQNNRAVDALDSISNKAKYGDILYIKAKSVAQDITLRVGTKLRIDGDFTLCLTSDVIVLIKNKNSWIEFHRSSNF